MWAEVASTIARIRRSATQRPLWQSAREIEPETERNTKFRDYEHRPDQHVKRIVDERRPATFEHCMSDDLQSPTDDEQPKRYDPYSGGTNMSGDCIGRLKNWDHKDDNDQSDPKIEQH